jgi:hypothetical protein
MTNRRLPGRGWASLFLVACAAVLLAGRVALTASDGAPDAPAAQVSSAHRVDDARSGNGRLRSRMIIDQGAAARLLTFEVQVRDPAWLTADDRMVRVVLRLIPEADRAFPLGLRRGAPSAADPGRPEAMSGGDGRSPERARWSSARRSSFGHRAVILSAVTPPGAMAELAYLVATLDVTSLARGDYVAYLELLDTTMAGRSSPGRVFPLDRTVHRYGAPNPPTSVVCCLREFRQ